MNTIIRKLLAAATLMPIVALANSGVDLVSNLEIVPGAFGTLTNEYSGVKIFLADDRDPMSAIARTRHNAGVIDITVENRDSAFCGSGSITNAGALAAPVANGTFSVAMSANGRHVAYSDESTTIGNLYSYKASIDCGATFVDLPLPIPAPFNAFGRTASGIGVPPVAVVDNESLLFDRNGRMIIAYFVTNTADGNDLTNTKLLLAKVDMPSKNITTIDLGNVNCSNGGTVNFAGDTISTALNNANQLVVMTQCGAPFQIAVGSQTLQNTPEMIVVDLNTNQIQQRMSAGSYNNPNGTNDGLPIAVASDGFDFYTLSRMPGGALSIGASSFKIKRWQEGTVGAGDFFQSNSNPTEFPFINLGNTAPNPYSDIVLTSSLDPAAATHGAHIIGFDGVKVGTRVGGVDLAWRSGTVGAGNLAEALKGGRRTRILGLSTPGFTFTTDLMEDYSYTNFQQVHPLLSSATTPRGYSTFFGGVGIYTYQAIVISADPEPGFPAPIFPAFRAGLDAYDIF